MDEAKRRSPDVTHRIMSRVRHKDSKAELALRRALFAIGLRYRIHAASIIGRPDVSIRSRRIAIFVDGDLWHGNPKLPSMRGRDDFAALFPSRTDWWLEKIERNIARDKYVTESLQTDGWLVIRVWESEILADPTAAAVDVARRIDESGH
jgi:DNA mismatch endonuclease (patch repair protein)